MSIQELSKLTALAAGAQPVMWMLTDEDRVNFRAQGAFVSQDCPQIRAAWDGPNSRRSRAGLRKRTT